MIGHGLGNQGSIPDRCHHVHPVSRAHPALHSIGHYAPWEWGGGRVGNWPFTSPVLEVNMRSVSVSLCLTVWCLGTGELFDACCDFYCALIYVVSLPAHSGSWPLIPFRNHFSKTPWMSDQLVERPLPKHRTAQAQNKRIYTPNIHALSGIRTLEPTIPASERARTVHALDRTATVTGSFWVTTPKLSYQSAFVINSVFAESTVF
jgi:hypothetical protein